MAIPLVAAINGCDASTLLWPLFYTMDTGQPPLEGGDNTMQLTSIGGATHPPLYSITLPLLFSTPKYSIKASRGFSCGIRVIWRQNFNSRDEWYLMSIIRAIVSYIEGVLFRGTLIKVVDLCEACTESMCNYTVPSCLSPLVVVLLWLLAG